MSDGEPPSRSRYMLRLSAFSRFLSPSSLSLPATSRVTALTQSSVRPCSTKLLARREDGSGVNIEGSVNGFLLGCYKCQLVDDCEMHNNHTASLDPVVCSRRSSHCSITLSASSLFQKHAKPVPRERPVVASIVIRAYRRGPNARNLRPVRKVHHN